MRLNRKHLGILIVTGLGLGADAPPSNLSEYKSPAQARTTVARKSAFESWQQGHLGVSVESRDGRVLVIGVEPGYAAEKAGMQVGDAIKDFASSPVPTTDALRTALIGKRMGETVTVNVDRAGKPLELKVKLTSASTPMRDASARPVLGVQLLETEKGVKIEGITPGSPAESAGIKIGDVVTKLDGEATRSLENFRGRLADRLPGDKVTLAVLRDEQTMEMSVALASPIAEEAMPTLSRWDERNVRVFRKPVYRLAVIPIAFTDIKPNEKIPPAAWETALFSTGVYKEKSPTGQNVYGSMNDYYNEMSLGKLKVEGKVFEPVTVGKKRSDYTQTASRSAVLTEACDQIIARDGEKALEGFDGIFFIYSGNRVQTQRGGIFWPHRSNFAYKGKRWSYFICPEGGERMASISVISHEFGHMLGLPDLYAKPEDPGSEGLGIWCSMSTGHGQDGKPLHFSAWCKEQMGWLKPAVIDPREKQKLILAPVIGTESECYKVLLRPDGAEYLLLENRVKKNFDRDLPGEGLLIWRVVDGKVVLEESHGISGPDGPRKFLGAVPFPSPANRSFTPGTTPSSKPSKPGGWPVHITDIRKLEDGRITFQIGFEYL
ncbi:MAG: M6 family metalloprotease domain-containing protein [Gemmataceae bacterium]|nr:M6 family metalloprotease domain-containing protein [Gemmataceae bacterium]